MKGSIVTVNCSVLIGLHNHMHSSIKDISLTFVIPLRVDRMS